MGTGFGSYPTKKLTIFVMSCCHALLAFPRTRCNRKLLTKTALWKLKINKTKKFLAKPHNRADIACS